MKKPIIILFFFVFSVFCIKNSFSQVVQKKADKWQLINGVKLGPGIKKQNFIKNQVNRSHFLINSTKTNDSKIKQYKVLKPTKSLKYSDSKSLNTIRKEDE